MVRQFVFSVIVAAAVSAAACGGGSGESTEAPANPPAAGTTTPPPAPAASPAAAPAPTSVADIFPEGPGKALVLNNCASCHNVACAAIGQRTAARWEALKTSHRENVPNAPIDDIFAYLSEHFSSDDPLPNVPPSFLEGGCTPF